MFFPEAVFLICKVFLFPFGLSGGAKRLIFFAVWLRAKHKNGRAWPAPKHRFAECAG